MYFFSIIRNNEYLFRLISVASDKTIFIYLLYFMINEKEYYRYLSQ